MPYKNKNSYKESKEAIKACGAIRTSDLIALERSIKIGDMILIPVQIPTRMGEEKTSMRRLKVVGKYEHILELWDEVSRRKRYISYKELMIQRRSELERVRTEC